MTPWDACEFRPDVPCPIQIRIERIELPSNPTYHTRISGSDWVVWPWVGLALWVLIVLALVWWIRQERLRG